MPKSALIHTHVEIRRISWEGIDVLAKDNSENHKVVTQ